MYVGTSAALLAELVARRGNKEESDMLFARATSILRSKPPDSNPDVLAAYAALARHHRAANRPDDEAYFRRLAEPR